MFRDLKPYPERGNAGLPWLEEIPSGWDLMRAKSVLRSVDIRSRTGEEELLTVSSSRGVVPRSGESVSMFAAASYVGHKLCWPDDLVINSLWAWGRGLGVTRFHGIVSSAYGVYRLDARRVHPWFLHALVRSEPFQWELQVRSQGVWRSRLQLTDDRFLATPLPLPPYWEQAAVVKYLAHAHRRIDHAIAAKRKLIALLEERRHVLINGAVTRGLDPSVPLKDSGIPWIAAAPGHWQTLELKRVLTALVDCEHKTAPYDENGVHRVVRTTAVRGGRLDWEGTYPTSAEAYESWTQRATPQAGDVIFTREAPAGEACVVPEGTPVCLGQRTVLMRVDHALVDPQFLVHQIYAGTAREQIRVATQGSTVGHLNMDDIGWMRVLMPSLSEQEQIVGHLSAATGSADAAIVRARQEIELLREFRTRLTADVVTGQLDVRHIAATLPDPDPDEPADDVGPAEDDLVDEAAEFLEDVGA